MSALVKVGGGRLAMGFHSAPSPPCSGQKPVFAAAASEGLGGGVVQKLRVGVEACISPPPMFHAVPVNRGRDHCKPQAKSEHRCISRHGSCKLGTRASLTPKT